jgi:nicotinate-nucleotide adenylyltransferase
VRLGLFGGTFDPPHVGHLLAASDAFEVLHLDRVVFIPNASQPLKGNTRQATAEERLTMTRLAVGDDARFQVDAREAERGGTSFTVETLEGFARQAPDDERYFLVGADIIRSFAHWRSPDRVANLARVAVLRRSDDAGSAVPEPTAAALVEEILRVAGQDALVPVVVPTRRIDVSSTEIRQRARDGLSIHGFVTEPVRQFIHERRLYR